MRISATMIEALRYYRTSDYGSIEDFEATIRGELVETDDMIRGRALHAVLAEPERCRRELLTSNAMLVYYEGHPDWRFGVEILSVRAAIAPTAVWEAKIEVPVGDHVLVCKADALAGRTVHEVKTPRSSFAVDKYFDSFQWRLYLWAFDCDLCVYEVVKAGERRDRNGMAPILWHESLPLYRYAGLEDECCEMVFELAEFVRQRGLEEYLERPRRREATG